MEKVTEVAVTQAATLVLTWHHMDVHTDADEALRQRWLNGKPLGQSRRTPPARVRHVRHYRLPTAVRTVPVDSVLRPDVIGGLGFWNFFSEVGFEPEYHKTPIGTSFQNFYWQKLIQILYFNLIFLFVNKKSSIFPSF